MASIEHTTYPRFKRSPSARELDALYTPSDEELTFAQAFTRGAQPRFGLLLLLKSFQRLGYFLSIEEIPSAIVQHVRLAIGMDTEVSPVYVELRTLYRHHQAIRKLLGVSAWDEDGLRVASEAMSAAADVMDNPVDLINVAIEELVRQRIELPAFSTLGRLSRRIRTLVNGRFFAAVMKRLSETERGQQRSVLFLHVYRLYPKSPASPLSICDSAAAVRLSSRVGSEQGVSASRGKRC
ncbi:hypothetical protein BURK2_01830 [Burkholderiales bacterium]|nr:hypothetical protein BURK2_01830 [Burkholderiales bacterium]